MNNLDRINEALRFIPVGGHDERVRVAFMLKSELGDAGRDLWDEWRGDRGCDEAASVWKSASETGPLKIGTLFLEAKANGWRDDGRYQKPTPEELAERRRIAAERATKEEVEIARERAETAKKAAAIWKATSEAKTDHPYFLRKRVSPVPTLREIDAGAAAAILGYSPKSGGDPLTGRLLAVPVKQGGRLSTLELIDENGRKAALVGRGSKVGGYWASERLPDGNGLTLLLGEGVATVLSAKEATGHPSVAALSSGNLPAVAKMIRERYPAAALVILADLVKVTGEPDPHAIEAAKVCAGGRLAIPDFGTDRAHDATDFNDMAVICGLEAVRETIEAALENRTKSRHLFFVGEPGEPGGTTSNGAAFGGSLMQGTEGTRGNHYPEKDERPCFCVYDGWRDDGKRKHRPGVYHHTAKEDQLIDTWICSPCHLLAQSNDGDANYGRVIDFVTSDGKNKRRSIPMQMLAGSGEELRGLLMGLGLEIDPKAHKLFGEYLQWRTPKEKIRCATQTGWHLTPTGKNVFVLPDAVYGEDADTVIFQSEAANSEKYRTGGTLAGWQALAGLASGNPMLMAAISSGFAGALLGPLHADGGGVHFVGDSSIGKTTILYAASSIWGGAEARGSWRSTSNGMEGAAAFSNDTALALDEISECDPKEVGAIVYATANGSGKQRAGRTGAARAVVKWRTFIISTGERTITTAMNEGGYRAKAGQQVRMLDIPAARQFGCFDDLHGHDSGASLSDHIKREADTHHGHAGRAFVEKLARANWHDLARQYELFKTAPPFNPANADGQVRRAAGRFALLALAGELATEWGITGWQPRDAMQAALLCFDLWRNARGHGGNDEARQIADAVSRFIDKHGDGRFSDLNSNGPPVRDRAGYWKQYGDERIYLFNSDGLREAVKGFDFGRALDALEGMGAIPAAGADGKRSTKTKVEGRSVSLYHITPSRLTGENHVDF